MVVDRKKKKRGVPAWLPAVHRPHDVTLRAAGAVSSSPREDFPCYSPEGVWLWPRYAVWRSRGFRGDTLINIPALRPWLSLFISLVLFTHENKHVHALRRKSNGKILIFGTEIRPWVLLESSNITDVFKKVRKNRTGFGWAVGKHSGYSGVNFSIRGSISRRVDKLGAAF